MQKTSFPFEIIVSDDCSSDDSQSVLLDYKQRYPDIIKLILGDTNIGGPRNLKRVIEASSARYITCLDGDDYYIDKYKLQKQVEFLEENDEYVACFHNVVNIYESTGVKSLFLPLDFPSRVDACDVISKKWFLPIHSVMLRRALISFPDWYETVLNDDYVINLSVVLHGPYYYMPDVMAVYRHHEKNTSLIYNDLILTDNQLKTILLGFREIYPKSFHPVFDQRIALYDQEIAFHTREIKQPWRKFFRWKTYKKLAKRILRKIV